MMAKKAKSQGSFEGVLDVRLNFDCCNVQISMSSTGLLLGSWQDWSEDVDLKVANLEVLTLREVVPVVVL